jgi:hypothetical protein
MRFLRGLILVAVALPLCSGNALADHNHMAIDVAPSDVTESAGKVRVTVEPHCIADEPIRYETSDGSAMTDSDYRGVRGELGGEGGSFELEILDDVEAERDEWLKISIHSVHLSSFPCGNGMGNGTSDYIVTIFDDDSARAPITQSSVFPAGAPLKSRQKRTPRRRSRHGRRRDR